MASFEFCSRVPYFFCVALDSPKRDRRECSASQGGRWVLPLGLAAKCSKGDELNRQFPLPLVL